MGCGTSSPVVPSAENVSNGHDKVGNGTKVVDDHKGRKDDHDDLPTVILPDTPERPKPLNSESTAPILIKQALLTAIAFEIPIEELDTSRKGGSSPPPHIQRLLQPPQPDITLPDIEGKLAEAESRRQMILQQRAASAQKRAQKMMKSLHEMDRLDSEHEQLDGSETTTKHGNTLKIPPEPAAWEDRNI